MRQFDDVSLVPCCIQQAENRWSLASDRSAWLFPPTVYKPGHQNTAPHTWCRPRQGHFRRKQYNRRYRFITLMKCGLVEMVTGLYTRHGRRRSLRGCRDGHQRPPHGDKADREDGVRSCQSLTPAWRGPIMAPILRSALRTETLICKTSADLFPSQVTTQHQEDAHANCRG